MLKLIILIIAALPLLSQCLNLKSRYIRMSSRTNDMPEIFSAKKLKLLAGSVMGGIILSTSGAVAIPTMVMASSTTVSDKEIVFTNLITVVKNPSQAKLNELDVASWPTWEKEVSTFRSTKKADEMFYVLKGKFTVTPDNGPTIEFEKGDLATFKKGLACTWDVASDVKKSYKEF